MRLNKIIILSTILLVFGGNLHGAADTAYDLNIDVNAFQLENGFQVLVSNARQPPRWRAVWRFEPGPHLSRPAKPALRICWSI
jgi:hypothetical protein